MIKIHVDKVALTQTKSWGSPFLGGHSDVICQLTLGKNFNFNFALKIFDFDFKPDLLSSTLMHKLH